MAGQFASVKNPLGQRGAIWEKKENSTRCFLLFRLIFDVKGYSTP